MYNLYAKVRVIYPKALTVSLQECNWLTFLLSVTPSDVFSLNRFPAGLKSHEKYNFSLIRASHGK